MNIIEKFKAEADKHWDASGSIAPAYREAIDLAEDFFREELKKIKKEHNKYCDALVKQNNMVLNEQKKEIIKKIEDQKNVEFYKLMEEVVDVESYLLGLDAAIKIIKEK